MQSQIDGLLENGRPAILTYLPDGPEAGRKPVYGFGFVGAVKTPKRVLGGILLGRLVGQPEFTASDEKLLTALAMQSALALENAQLFARTDEKLAQRVKELTRKLPNGSKQRRRCASMPWNWKHGTRNWTPFLTQWPMTAGAVGQPPGLHLCASRGLVRPVPPIS